MVNVYGIKKDMIQIDFDNGVSIDIRPTEAKELYKNLADLVS